MTHQGRTLVVGAGALGTAAALHLALRGHDVTVLDADGIAARTTGMAAGILSLGVVDDTDRRMVAATLAAFDAYDRADAKTASESFVPLMRRPGSQILAGPGVASDHLRHVVKDTLAIGQGANVWEPDTWVRDMDRRGIGTDIAGISTVASIPADAWTLSTDATHRMYREARALGVRFETGRSVAALSSDGSGGIDGVRLHDGSEVKSALLVLAAGAWTPKLLAARGLALPVRPYRTHAAILETPDADRFPILHDDALGYYIRPEGPRHLLVGDGTRTDHTDPEGFTNEAERSFLEDVATLVPQRFPSLADAHLSNAWRGVLSGTPDRGALVGPHPDMEGLALVTGGNGFGFMRSWALGATLAAMVGDGQRPHGDVADPDPAWIRRNDVGRFWPEPPTTFDVIEGFTLDV